MNDEAGEADRTGAYVLGHSDGEIERLKAQARLIDPITRRMFEQAGVAPGMRVLDVGCGAGDVAFLAADLVGPDGEVVGVDQAPGAVEAARARAGERTVGNVAFHVGDPAEMTFERPFDTVVGRYVLQHQKHPAAMLRGLAAQVSPGGLVVFHELDWGGPTSFPPAPTYDRCRRWGLETLRAHGTETRMGSKLHSTFVEAGRSAPSMRLEALIGAGGNCADMLRLMSGLIATLLPEIERLGVATGAEIDVETLFDRMQRESAEGSNVFFGHLQIGAWSRT